MTTYSTELTMEEMKLIVDEDRELAFDEQRARDRRWGAEQRAKAPAIAELLKQHLPAHALQEVLEFVSTWYGAECFCDALLGREPGSTDRIPF